jgi:hypothetical protein
MVMVDLLVEACEAARDRLAGVGITLDLRRVDNPPKPGTRLDATPTKAFAQLVLWETGELDLVIADPTTGDVLINEHREVSSEVGIADALSTIEAHLVDTTGQ